LQRHPGALCPGVAALMGSLAQVPDPPAVGLLTGNIRLGAGLKLAAHGLASSFVLGAFGDDHLDRNELARIALQRGSAHLGRVLAGDEVVVIGDTRADIECARAIGARCLAVATGGESLPELLEHSPAEAVDSLEDWDWDRVIKAGRAVERPVDWDALYQARDTRWDHGEVAPGLEDFLADWPADLPRGGSVLVPGCGRGHDARAWALAGFDVLGLDLAPTAMAEAKALAGGLAQIRFRAGDFLSDAPKRRVGRVKPVDWLFEHTLFCAIPPGRREDYVRSAARWVRPGGHLLAIHYLQPSDAEGPPFGVTVNELRRRFDGDFELLRHWVPRSFASRTGRERVFLWRRRFSG
ncbi:MAG: HAD hydrolase-like protein, partial [Verrucomicrobiae bacterium]|nr:HAD hydrolase-like protein [Verrucomicrobiae bacterium]